VFEPENLASLEINGDTGVYGELDAPPQGKLTPVALRSEVKTGPAQVLVTVSGTEKKLYDVEIEKVSSSVAGNQKNMTIRVTDPALISATGGIVQGMSGSPLLQNGMLIGAVTHVFVNSPLEGYAIFAETMLETARQTAANRSPES
jgi:stage IV sporulation protein B